MVFKEASVSMPEKTNVYKDKRAWWLSHEAFLTLKELARQKGLQSEYWTAKCNASKDEISFLLISGSPPKRTASERNYATRKWCTDCHQARNRTERALVQT